jgi:hypothetical protein
MLHLFDRYASLFKTWQVVRYEQEGEAYLLQVTALLQDDSRLEVRDYLFIDGSRTYAYQWMEIDGALRRRWDNTPHWPNITTFPHHTHLPGQTTPESSVVTNLEDLLQFIQDWLTSKQTKS